MHSTFIAAAFAVLMVVSSEAHAVTAKPDISNVVVPISRSSLVVLPSPMAEVMIADPEIADVHAHNASNLSIVGKKLGRTNVRIFDKNGKLMRQFDVTVGHDLPAIRMALRNFLPDENIGVEMVNSSVALTGQVSNATAAEKAVKIVRDFVRSDKNTGAPAEPGQADPNILDLLQITSGQQVQLRVRVGEINRSALKTLGIDLSTGLSDSVQLATGAGLGGLLTPVTVSDSNTSTFQYGPGSFLFPTDANNRPTNTQGLIIGRVTNGNKTVLAGALQALEQDGLFKLLAEPNLVAISGEQAEFLAGGEIPLPVPQGGSATGSANITIEYKPYGVAVRFKPFVLSENRIRMEVQPEVSELDPGNGVNFGGFTVPALTTRRANTTVELAPGESFMIAGLLKDRSQASLEQLPGVKELPVLGALFRSTEFQRNETELVIAVTPYIVDPLKSSDVKLPTDNFRPASQMEMFFYGALGSLSGNAQTISQTPVEGPIGFMTD
jgi:pilus assembly protein CpaC